jgi:uncharacterized Zn-finger protein
MSDNKFSITCPKCGQKFSVTAPVPAVMNDLRCSGVVAPHEKPVRCVGCGQEYGFAAVTGAIDWDIFPLNDQQSEYLRGSKIITPDNGLKVIG